jgi:hypothetical protein
MSRNRDNEYPIFRGFGLEHEMMFFFHPMPELIQQQNEVPIFDMKSSVKAISLGSTLQYLKTKADLPKDALDFLYSMPGLEQSGRKCGGKWVLKKAGDDLLVEFANRGWFTQFNLKDDEPNRYLDNYVDNLIEQETEFISTLTTYCPSIQKARQEHGQISGYSVGMAPYIQASKSKEKPFEFRETENPDYTGSFHMTITLPFPFRDTWTYSKEENRLFIEMHQNFANMIQWIEPLLCSVLFTPDLRASGPQNPNEPPKTRGSFRIFNLGWGNFAGSDLRKLDKGISRYANIKPYWRKKLKDMAGTDKLKYCDSVRLEKGAISAVGSDFRTFGSKDLLRPWHRESGLPMNIPNGLEIRILDHLDTVYLYFVVQLVVLIAERSRTFNMGQNYVYKNNAWIEAMNQVMRQGWRARLPTEYIQLVESYLGVSLGGGSRRASDIMTSVYQQLWKQHHKGLWTELLLTPEMREVKFDVPNVNREGWELGFLLWLAKNKKENAHMKEWLMQSLPEKWESWEEWGEIWTDLKGHLGTKYEDEAVWGTQNRDVCYLLESLGLIQLNPKTGAAKRVEEKEMAEIVVRMDNWTIYFRQISSMMMVYMLNIIHKGKKETFESFLKDRVLYEKFKFIYQTMKNIEGKKPILIQYFSLVVERFENRVPSKKRRQVRAKNKSAFKKSQVLPTWVKHPNASP